MPYRSRAKLARAIVKISREAAAVRDDRRTLAAIAAMIQMDYANFRQTLERNQQ